LMVWKVIDGTGNVLLDGVEMSDWLMISNFGNGYLEYKYNYATYDTTYRYYDEHLNLKAVYGEEAASLPDTEDMLPGVDYYFMDGLGCVVDADGKPVLNWAIFLDKFGDGENMELKTQLYNNVRLAEEDAVYPVWYQNKVYVLDRYLNLLALVEDPDIVEDFDFAEFRESFCYYRYNNLGDRGYFYYDGTPVQMTDGVVPDYMETNWNDSGYLKYRTFGDRVYIEEYTADGDLVKFNVELPENTGNLKVSYSEAGYVMVSRDCGEKVPSPYAAGQELLPVCEKTLYYRGEPVANGKGMEYDYVYSLDDETALWVVQTGDVLTAESESLYEEYENTYILADYTIIKDGKVLYGIDNAYQIAQCNEAVFFLKGNYIYAVGYDGTEYVRARHTFLNND